MSKEQRNLKSSIQKAMKTPVVNDRTNIDENNYDENKYYDNNGENKHYDNSYDEIKQEIEPEDKIGFDPQMEHQEDNRMEVFREKSEAKDRIKILEKPLKIFGGFCIAVAIVALIFTNTANVDTSQSAQNALKNKVSTAISAGTVLLAADENPVAQDYTITHTSTAENTKIWVWDYAAEDGDYVQVLVNGVPVGDAFMIKHKTKEITVPATGNIQIKGIRDGGGGITYAVRFDINGTSYFNGTPEGQFNTYTLELAP